MAKYKITKNKLGSVINEAVKDVLKEGPFGINSDFLQRIGMKNPGDSYPVNYQEIIQNCDQFQTYLNQFKEYLSGKEEEVESEEGEKNYGVAFNAKMKNMWWDPEDWNKQDFQSLAESLEELSGLLRDVSWKIEEVKECAEYFLPRK